jgi:hypothetical protein
MGITTAKVAVVVGLYTTMLLIVAVIGIFLTAAPWIGYLPLLGSLATIVLGLVAVIHAWDWPNECRKPELKWARVAIALGILLLAVGFVLVDTATVLSIVPKGSGGAGGTGFPPGEEKGSPPGPTRHNPPKFLGRGLISSRD